MHSAGTIRKELKEKTLYDLLFGFIVVLQLHSYGEAHLHQKKSYQNERNEQKRPNSP